MIKFLMAPGFEFIGNIIPLLTNIGPKEDSDETYKRVLVYPTTNGLRLRTMNFSLSVTIEVLGVLAKVEFLEKRQDGEISAPYIKEATFSITDYALVAEQLEGFFNRTWEIEKD